MRMFPTIAQKPSVLPAQRCMQLDHFGVGMLDETCTIEALWQRLVLFSVSQLLESYAFFSRDKLCLYRLRWQHI